MRIVLGLLAIAAISCRQLAEPPTQISVSMQADGTVVTRGDTVTFTVNATGNNLIGVVIDYGDESTDQYATGGALSARVTFKHVYSAAGSFTVRATVTDAARGETEVTTVIRVN